MSRFTPDTWLDAVLRPAAMAAPNSWVYIEVAAPDFRFLFLIALMLSLVGIAAKRRSVPRAARVLLVFLILSFVPWLYTTGNGRYFIVPLLVVGVVCIALAKALPLSRDFRLTLVLMMVVLQGFALSQNDPWNPWNTWGFADWKKAPYFDIELDEQAANQPATYVTLTAASYSVIAPQFPAAARWINLNTLINIDPLSLDAVRVQNFLSANANSLQLMIPSMPEYMTLDGKPDHNAFAAVSMLLANYHLAPKNAGSCRLLPSRTLAEMGFESLEKQKSSEIRKRGFWVCPLVYSTQIFSSLPPTSSQSLAIFEKLERSCPRFFYPGLIGSTPVPQGTMRHYSDTDMKLYVFDNGEIYYKYYRALNPVRIGNAKDILQQSYQIDCKHIQGRSGRPWDREI